MKRIRVRMAAAAAVLALGMIPGEVRAEGRKIRAGIPFAFRAGNYTLPAGSYVFEHMATKPVLVITAPDGGRIALLTHPAGKAEEPAAPGLVFEHDDGVYWLTEAWAPGAAHRAGVQPARKAGLAASSRQRVRVVASLTGR